MLMRNEMKCLSNAVLQSCLREELDVVLDVVPLVRNLVVSEQIRVKDIVKVWLWKKPQGDEFVRCRLEVVYDEADLRRSHFKEFDASGLKVESREYLLYDQAREGVLEYLHLVH